MIFRKLTAEDESLVFGILREAADWLKDKNIDYWQNWHNPTEGQYKWIMAGLENSEFYAVYDGDQKDDRDLTAMVRLQYEDEMFWGKKDDKCVYIHSFTVNRRLAGKRTGYKILEKIEEDHKNRGFQFMRLDCGPHLEKLVNYYKRFGFRAVGEGEVSGYRLVFLEKEIL